MKIMYELVEYLNEKDETVTLLRTDDLMEIDEYLKENVKTLRYRDLRIEIKLRRDENAGQNN